MYLSPQSFKKKLRKAVKEPSDEKTSEDREVLILKGFNGGPVKEIKMCELKKKIEYLKTQKNVYIKNMDGKTEKIFSEVSGIIDVMYESGVYDHINKLITEIFIDVKECNFGTVGCYFAGCNVDTNFKGNPRCTPYCSGSIPPSSSKGYYPCENLVIVYNDKNDFTKTNNPENNKYAYIYVNSKNSFNGFSKQEIDKLIEIGIEKAKLIKFDEKMKKFSDTCPDFVPVNELPLRNGNDNSGGIFFILLLILLFLFVLYYVFSRKRRSY